MTRPGLGTGVTLVSVVRVRKAAAAEHADLHAEGVEAATQSGGLLGAELIPAVPGLQDDTVALHTFATRADLDRWVGSEARRHILECMEPLASSDRTVSVLRGYPGWFGGAPPRWKQACAVMVGLIPVASLVVTLRQTLLPHAPFLAAVAFTSTLNVVLLTWVVMPPLNRVLAGWLTGRAKS